MVDAATLRILNRGPEYLRARMLHRDGGILDRRRTKTVAEELAESKPLYSRKISIDESHDVTEKSHDQAELRSDATLENNEEQENETPDIRTKHEQTTMDTGSRTPPYKSLPRRQDSLPIQMQRSDSGPKTSDTLHRICSVDIPDHRISETSGPTESPSNTGLSDPGYLGRQSSFTRSRPKIPTIATLEYKDNDAYSSDTEKKSNASSHHKHDNGSPSGNGGVVRRRHRKMISRSRSDLTKRLSNSSDLSELGLRLSRNSADLERFFNEMGLERDILQPMLSSQYAAAAQWPSVYESVSCIASPDNHSLCSGKSIECCNSSDRNNVFGANGEMRSLDTMSVVERNARIIKWLGGVKKAAGSASD